MGHYGSRNYRFRRRPPPQAPPGRRTRALRAPDTPARGNHDTFTHQGTAYELLRVYPGDEPAQAMTHYRTTAEIPTKSGSVFLPVKVTAQTTHLVHIAWIDDTGELVGTWCPTDMVRIEYRPRN